MTNDDSLQVTLDWFITPVFLGHIEDPSMFVADHAGKRVLRAVYGDQTDVVECEIESDRDDDTDEEKDRVSRSQDCYKKK